MLSQQKFQSEKKAPQPTQSWEKNNWKVFLVNSKKSKAVSIWKKRVSGSRHILLEDQKSYSDFRQKY